MVNRADLYTVQRPDLVAMHIGTISYFLVCIAYCLQTLLCTTDFLFMSSLNIVYVYITSCCVCYKSDGVTVTQMNEETRE